MQQAFMTGTSAHFQTLIANSQAECRALDSYIHKNIPLTQAMQAHAISLDTSGLTLGAPLAANHNHQANAFGGSLASLAMLAGWGLIWLALKRGRSTIIVVHDMQMEFMRPVNGELQANCELPTFSGWEKFTNTLDRRHKARLKLCVKITCAGELCARCSGQFVAYHENTGDK
jgi:thioesterase domain-containing protein